MPKKSKINIFNKMEPQELHDKIRECNVSPRYYQRLIAMRLIEEKFNHNEVANILGVSYRSINRWAHLCEENGIKGLEPDFSGGKRSKLTPELRIEFQKILRESDNLTMTGAKKILKDEFGIEFSLGYVGEIVRSLGFNYGSPRPKYSEASDNPKEDLKKTLKWQG